MSCQNCKCAECAAMIARTERTNAADRRIKDRKDERAGMMAAVALLRAGGTRVEPLVRAFRAHGVGRPSICGARLALDARVRIDAPWLPLPAWERRLMDAGAIPPIARGGSGRRIRARNMLGDVMLPPDNWPIGTTKRKCK